MELEPVKDTTPATVAKVVEVTDDQTSWLNKIGWLRQVVGQVIGAVVVVLGMLGIGVTFTKVPPTPPDAGIEKLIEIFSKGVETGKASAPRQETSKATDVIGSHYDVSKKVLSDLPPDVADKLVADYIKARQEKLKK